jgi:hypothetical protein
MSTWTTEDREQVEKAMNNELTEGKSAEQPVAYLVKAPDGEYLVFEHTEHPVMADCTYIPLYTHPAKTLTDEEILNVAFCCEVDTVSIQNDWDGTVIDFARAILRKAQEK